MVFNMINLRKNETEIWVSDHFRRRRCRPDRVPSQIVKRPGSRHGSAHFDRNQYGRCRLCDRKVAHLRAAIGIGRWSVVLCTHILARIGVHCHFVAMAGSSYTRFCMCRFATSDALQSKDNAQQKREDYITNHALL
jgi:hypothetical protein